MTAQQLTGTALNLIAIAGRGGGEIKVPDDWLVSMEGISLFGAFVDETDQQTPGVAGTPQKRLIMKGASLMGGIVVKN